MIFFFLRTIVKCNATDFYSLFDHFETNKVQNYIEIITGKSMQSSTATYNHYYFHFCSNKATQCASIQYLKTSSVINSTFINLLSKKKIQNGANRFPLACFISKDGEVSRFLWTNSLSETSGNLQMINSTFNHEFFS